MAFQVNMDTVVMFANRKKLEVVKKPKREGEQMADSKLI